LTHDEKLTELSRLIFNMTDGDFKDYTEFCDRFDIYCDLGDYEMQKEKK